jgi:cytochrome P450
VTQLDIDLEFVDWTAWAADPYPLYRTLRDRSPVFWDAPNETYVLTRYDDVYAVLADHKRFSSVPLGILEGTQMPTSEIRQQDEPRHTFVRRIVLPMFTPAEMRRLEPYLREVARGLVDAAEGDDVVNASTAFAIPLPGRVTLDLLGLPLESHARFKELTDDRLRIILNRGSHAETSDAEVRLLAEIRAEMWEIVTPVIEARRVRPEHDAISRVAQAQEQHGRDEIPDDLFLNILLELLAGGFETTQHLIELLLSHLADHPELWQSLREDRELVPVAIEEMLRWQSPVQALGRRATEDVAIRGVEVPEDTWVTTVYGSANRDEREFDDPDRYRLDRDLKRHVAFSAGIHYCAGAPVTRGETRALLNELLDRYPVLERAGESEPWPNSAPGKVGQILGLRKVPLRLRRS